MGWPDDCVLVETLVRCNLALLYSRYGEHKNQAQRTRFPPGGKPGQKSGLSVTAAKIHPGHEAVAQALKKEGTPPNRVLHAGFMPGDIVENAKGERENQSGTASRLTAFLNWSSGILFVSGKARQLTIFQPHALDQYPSFG